MEDQGSVGPIPELDELFVLGARQREPSHRERQLEAERRRAEERAARYRAELDRGMEMRRRGYRRAGRPSRRRSGPPQPSSLRRRQVLGLILVAAVVAAAVYLERPPSPSPPGAAPAVVAPGPCPDSLYPAGSQYRFERCAGGDPVSWERCSTLTVSPHPAGAPVGWHTDVDNALSQLSTATGLHFRSTTGNADISIGWASPLDVSRGLGGDRAGYTRARTLSDLTGTRLISADIEISTALSSGTSRTGEVPVLLHELGHAVGLGHYEGAQVMNPVDEGYASYRSGDIAGLATLYRPSVCK